MKREETKFMKVEEDEKLPKKNFQWAEKIQKIVRNHTKIPKKS